MKSTFENFESSSEENRRLLRQEQLILDVTEALCERIEADGVSRSEIAKRLGKTKGHISRLLSGERNLTLRSIADLSDSLGCIARFGLVPQVAHMQEGERIVKRLQWEPRRIKLTFRPASVTTTGAFSNSISYHEQAA